MSPRELEEVAVAALRQAQRAYDDAMAALHQAKMRVKNSATPEARALALEEAEREAREHKERFVAAAKLVQDAANALLSTKAAFDAAEAALRLARLNFGEGLAAQEAQAALVEAEAAVARGKDALVEAGRELSRQRKGIKERG